MELTTEQEAALRHLKGAFPFRICWFAVKQNEEPRQGADYTRHKCNKLARAGWSVFIVA